MKTENSKNRVLSDEAENEHSRLAPVTGRFYVLSLKHTGKFENLITLWRPDNKGYCYTKESAGLYEEIIKDYHDNESNMAVAEEILDRLFISVEYDGMQKHAIPNSQIIWDILGVKMTKHCLVRKVLQTVQ